MTWFKVDDSFHSHPKTAAVSLAALGLWAVAGSWAGAHLTDGFVPEHMVPLLSRGSSELADELVKAGLWKRNKGGYRFHDWSERNPSRQQVEQKRAARAEAGRKGGLASGKTRSKRASKTEANASPTVQPPTRPDPPPSKEGGEGARPVLHEFRRPAPVLGDATRQRAAEARAAIRKPQTQQRWGDAFAELVTATQPPPDETSEDPPPSPVIPLRSA